jgi:tetratricopeptide (TPR) repeat protein
MSDAPKTDPKTSEPTPPGGIPRAFGGDDDVLDVARGELTDEDLDQLEAAIDAVDFATRRASPERMSRLGALVLHLTDVAEQIKSGTRRPKLDRQELSAEQLAKYQGMIDEGVNAGEQGDLVRARKVLEGAVRLHPEGIEGLFNLGVVYGLIAHHEIAKAEFYDNYVRDEIFVEKAKICYDHVLELDPKHLPSLRNLATLYAMREERDVAKEYLTRILAITPADDNEKGLVDQARQQLEELESI